MSAIIISPFFSDDDRFLAPAKLDRLRKELKNRGDLARKLLAEKDDELRRMRERLRTPPEQVYRQSLYEDNKMPRQTTASGNYSTFTSSPLSENNVLNGSGETHGEAETSAQTQDMHTEQDILLLAKMQAQRDEETGRLRKQLQQAQADLEQAQSSLKATEHNVQALRDQLASQKQHQAQDISQLSPTQLDGVFRDRMIYLKNAFLGFFRAKTTPEKASLGRVISQILGFSEEEQQVVNHAINASTSGPLSFTGLFG